ncbi:beta-ketoacyl-ACP synthase II [Venenivibrio stagnispumantis]|uniref:3-oxoacyl-[acyl-carrier-protein] synthase 2 n=1 Tax=Venenivibrio stagnispumantis TaxID=407998 RepID=A0AA45WKN9_9AQUI|nr:beta-ketoacyl-ACP synthase II [Venenivibrio stagnispumantis]MCW4573013.1 beta-ketoacyl-ACP synthase II [Venenivibrio stagnispumantis]SMP07804.1 3-oxoacyl-[acyl-carrier-protein] synthase II [Venenivibrio stagnispumantis]
MRRVVITGLGAVTPLGENVKEYWEGLINGKSGIDIIKRFDPVAYNLPVLIAGEVKNIDYSKYLDSKELKRMSDFVKFAVIAAKEAILDSGLDLEKIDKEKAGVIVGTGIGGLRDIEEQQMVLMEKGARRVSPFFIPSGISNMASGYISIEFGFKGPNSCVVTACATGTHSIGDAFKIIQRGDADIMIAGGTESAITPLGIAGFANMKALSTRNEEPTKASRPFDAERDGFVMGEGAGILVLEELEHAIKRGAKIYAEVVGYGMTGDAYHITAPCADADGAIRVMKMALNDARINPTEVDYINAHGTSTPLNDRVETHAIKEVFKEHAYKLKISSVKSMIGHLLGAAGAVEAVATALTIKHGIIPPTINYEHPDPYCDLDYVPNKAIEYPVKVAISNSFGFGGTNACLVFKAFE